MTNEKDLERARKIVEQAKAQDSCDVYDSLVTDFAAAFAAVREEFHYSIHAQQAIYETLCKRLSEAESQLATVRDALAAFARSNGYGIPPELTYYPQREHDYVHGYRAAKSQMLIELEHALKVSAAADVSQPTGEKEK